MSCSVICFLEAASVLVTTRTIGAFTSRSWRAMNASPVPTGWSAGMQNTITSTSESVSRTTSLSRLPSRLFGLCRPGVSTRTIWPAGLCTTPRIACRVVCGRLLTMPTFSPTSALVSVVLPALGRPTRATKPLRCGDCSGLLTLSVSHRGETSRPRHGGVVPALGVLQHSRSRNNTPEAGHAPDLWSEDGAVAGHAGLTGVGAIHGGDEVLQPIPQRLRPAAVDRDAQLLDEQAAVLQRCFRLGVAWRDMQDDPQPVRLTGCDCGLRRHDDTLRRWGQPCEQWLRLLPADGPGAPRTAAGDAEDVDVHLIIGDRDHGRHRDRPSRLVAQHERDDDAARIDVGRDDGIPEDEAAGGRLRRVAPAPAQHTHHEGRDEQRSESVARENHDRATSQATSSDRREEGPPGRGSDGGAQ